MSCREYDSGIIDFFEQDVRLDDYIFTEILKRELVLSHKVIHSMRV